MIGNVADGGNLISENELGIRLSGESHDNVVSNNDISRNRSHGISFYKASGNLIGGASIADGNQIFSNGDTGIYVYEGTGNRLESNSIHSNGKLGIDLRGPQGSGVTTNDNLDADTGANGLQNFPIIDSLGFVNLATIVNGTFRSAANTAYLLQFFSNELPESNGYGEGKTLLGSKSVTTGTNGEVTFQASFANTTLNPGQTVSAIAIARTATRPSSRRSSACQRPSSKRMCNRRAAKAEQKLPLTRAATLLWLGWDHAPVEPFTSTIWFRRFRADGTPLDDADREAPSTVDSVDVFDVAMDDAGNFVLVWHDYSVAGDEEGGVYGRRFDAAGNRAMLSSFTSIR